jgi:hypothetical protein
MPRFPFEQDAPSGEKTRQKNGVRQIVAQNLRNLARTEFASRIEFVLWMRRWLRDAMWPREAMNQLGLAASRSMRGSLRFAHVAPCVVGRKPIVSRID